LIGEISNLPGATLDSTSEDLYFTLEGSSIPLKGSSIFGGRILNLPWKDPRFVLKTLEGSSLHPQTLKGASTHPDILLKQGSSVDASSIFPGRILNFTWKDLCFALERSFESN
jgi:hypothetical protein